MALHPCRIGPRELLMADMYRAGMTLQQIGDVYEVSRERVRQILYFVGVPREEGGAKVRANRRNRKIARDRTAAREARAIATFGCGYETARRLNEGDSLSDQRSLAIAFCSHRSNAKKRGIGFELTFPQWISIWAESGQIHNRGLGADQYCMGRYGDTGPYAVGNVYITTASQNHIDYWAAVKAGTKQRGAANDS